MNCAFCEIENNQIVKEHTIYELEWDDDDKPVFFESKIGLCKKHQNSLEIFAKKQKFMNQIQLSAIGILFISLIILIFYKNFWGVGAVTLFILGLLWYRNRSNQRYLRSEEDCIAYGYQIYQEEKNPDKEETVLYFSKKEKQRIFRI